MYFEYLNSLIISADDFGVSKKANETILELARQKKINRLSIMIGGKISQKEAEELLKLGIKLDIHLHLLSADFFITREKEASKNVFWRMVFFIKNIVIGKYSSKKVQAIWKKQIEEFYALFGKYPDGINSHEHLHFFPTFFKAALNLKKEFKISYLRFGKKRYKLKFIPVAFILDFLRGLDLKIYSNKFKTSNYVVSFDWIEKPTEFFKNLSKNKKNEKIELIFHPERNEEYKFLRENF